METTGNVDPLGNIIALVDRMAGDSRINVWHISVLLAIAAVSYRNGGSNPTRITRKLVMRLAHIGSLGTYHRCMRQLDEYGYIVYKPSYNYYDGTKVTLNYT